MKLLFFLQGTQKAESFTETLFFLCVIGETVRETEIVL